MSIAKLKELIAIAEQEGCKNIDLQTEDLKKFSLESGHIYDGCLWLVIKQYI